jgi:hypothetical protein
MPASDPVYIVSVLALLDLTSLIPDWRLVMSYLVMPARARSTASISDVSRYQSEHLQRNLVGYLDAFAKAADTVESRKEVKKGRCEEDLRLPMMKSNPRAAIKKSTRPLGSLQKVLVVDVRLMVKLVFERDGKCGMRFKLKSSRVGRSVEYRMGRDVNYIDAREFLLLYRQDSQPLVLSI